MKPLLSLKILYRAPIKTILTFILLAVVTFAFFSQTAEYAITSREFNNAAMQYYGVGSAEIAPPEESNPSYPWNLALDETEMQQYRPLVNTSTNLYQPLTQEQISDIAALPYITTTDTRYMTAGVSDIYDRLDDGNPFYNFTTRCIIEGTLVQVDNKEYNEVLLDDCTLLAGNAIGDKRQRQMTFAAISFKTTFNPGLAGGPVTDRVDQIPSPDYIYDTEYLKNLTIGDRYVFVLRFDPEINKIYWLGDHLSNQWCSAIWPVDGATDNYLETEDYTPLRKLIEITNADIHTFDMVYTEDMRSIMRFADGSMTILNGRALAKEDSESNLNVCVVSRAFAEANKLEVGDTITMKLGTQLIEQYKALGAVAGTPERYEPAKELVTLEIVGIYTDTDSPYKQVRQPHWTYSVNTIFIPTSLLPVDESTLSDHKFTPGEFSFKVENAWDIPAFLEESAPKFEEMGLTLIFDDDGWMDISQDFHTVKQISLMKIAVLAAAIASATGFVVYMFISRKKKEYAIMRALGTTERVSVRALLLPLMALTGVAVLVGSGLAWIYTVKTVACNNTVSMMQEFAVSTAVPAGVVLGCVLGEILLTLLIALMLLRRIGNLSPIALLQGNGRVRRRKKMKAPLKKTTETEMTLSLPLIQSVPPVAMQLLTETLSIDPPQTGHKNTSPRFILRYIEKHIRRAAGKSALAVLMAALLFAVVGQFALMKQSYFDLCINTDVKANFVGGLELGAIPSILSKDHVTDPYYEARQIVDLNAMSTSLTVTNNISRYTGEEADITYTHGYDASVMDKTVAVIIVGKTLMERYGLELGEKVRLSDAGLFEKIRAVHVDKYREEHPKDELTDEEIQALLTNDILKQFNGLSRIFTIAGVVSTPSSAYDDMVFSPGAYASARYGTLVKLDVAEFTLADNFKADEFRVYAEQVSKTILTGRIAFVMDTSELEHLLNSLRLLEKMHPIVVAAALLIGGFICSLVIFQSSKEAAIMRILGTTKRRTRIIMALEQVLLSVFGLAVGAFGLLLYKGSSLSVISGQLAQSAALYFAVILLSAVICSGLATRRNVLELLQTKE